MSETLYEALEVCLQALETGADSESVLSLFPELKEELSPLLDVSRQARLLAAPVIPEAAQRRGKARVLGHAATLRASRASRGKQRAIFTFQRLALSLGVSLLFLFSSTGLLRASAGALPGDNLYPVKRTWEDVRLLFVFNPESREELETEFERERLHEVDELLAEGRHEPITFTGVVTKQTDSLWVVSGVNVQIAPGSRLPARPVTPGTAVFLQGWTDAQGFVEANFIEVLEPGQILPTRQPAETEPQEDNSNDDNDEQLGSPSNENQNDNGDGIEHGDDGGNDNSGDNGNGKDEDHKENDGKGDNGNEKDKGDNGGSGDGGGQADKE